MEMERRINRLHRRLRNDRRLRWLLLVRNPIATETAGVPAFAWIGNSTRREYGALFAQCQISITEHFGRFAGTWWKMGRCIPSVCLAWRRRTRIGMVHGIGQGLAIAHCNQCLEHRDAR